MRKSRFYLCLTGMSLVTQIGLWVFAFAWLWEINRTFFAVAIVYQLSGAFGRAFSYFLEECDEALLEERSGR